MLKSPLTGFLLALGVGLIVGCGGKGGGPRVPVSGKVTGSTAKGSVPVAKAEVTFHPRAGGAEGQTPPSGVADEDGTFKFDAPPGDYHVTVRWPQQTKVGWGDRPSRRALRRSEDDQTVRHRPGKWTERIRFQSPVAVDGDSPQVRLRHRRGRQHPPLLGQRPAEGDASP